MAGRGSHRRPAHLPSSFTTRSYRLVLGPPELPFTPLAAPLLGTEPLGIPLCIIDPLLTVVGSAGGPAGEVGMLASAFESAAVPLELPADPPIVDGEVTAPDPRLPGVLPLSLAVSGAAPVPTCA
jgi:hypothetical protein